MEKITISKIEQKASKTGTPFWACQCPNGSKYTVWDAGIAGMIGMNLNRQCEADTKQSGDFWNIRAFTPSNITPQAEQILDTGKQECFVNPPEPLIKPSVRDSSIISQCLVKCATEIISKGAYTSTEGVGQQLNELMVELVGTYKTGVKLLNA